eukprot:scaffold458169_cov19-Prasinocladus_malaysianus.AAC.1
MGSIEWESSRPQPTDDRKISRWMLERTRLTSINQEPKTRKASAIMATPIAFMLTNYQGLQPSVPTAHSWRCACEPGVASSDYGYGKLRSTRGKARALRAECAGSDGQGSTIAILTPPSS